MTLAAEQSQAMAAQWQVARRIFPVYKAIAQQFKLAAPRCPELETPPDRADAKVLAAASAWLQKMDELIGVHQLRRFAQTSPLSTETTLNALAQHYLAKEPPSDADRDKLDFVLAQYFAQCVPTELVHREITLADVVRVLQPVLGEVPPQVPAWLKPLEESVGRVRIAANVHDLMRSGALENARKLKSSGDPRRYEPAVLAAFTRFNFIVRQVFVRLIDKDFEAISSAVRDLKQQGITEIDCRRAQMGQAETLERVLEAARQLKKPFAKEYSSGNPLVQLAELQSALEEALAKIAGAALPPEAKAASASQPKPAITVPPSLGTAAAPKPAPEPAAERPKSAPAAEKISPAEPAAANEAIPQALAQELTSMMAQLTKFLAADAARTRTAGATIVLGKIRVPLSSWEVKAFVEGLGNFSQVVQQGVAMRILLAQALASAEAGKAPSRMREMAAGARTLGQRLEQQLAAARQVRNIEAGATISAAGQRLAATLAEADRVLQEK